MLACVLNTPQAVTASVEVVRAFVRMRAVLADNADLARRVAAMESRLDLHDDDFRVVFEALCLMLDTPSVAPRQIGFRPDSGTGPEAAS